MEVLGDSGGGRVTHREKLKRFLGQQVMDQKVKENSNTERNLVWGLMGQLGDGQEDSGSPPPGWGWRWMLAGPCNIERKRDLCPAW